MSAEFPPQLDAPRADEAWSEIDKLLDTLAQLAKSDLPPADFAAAVVDRIVSGLAALGGRLWRAEGQGPLTLEYQTLRQAGSPADQRAALDAHRRLAEAVRAAGQARVVLPHASAGEQGLLNPSDALVILCPWRVDDACLGVLEVVQRPTAGPDVQQGNLRFLAVVAELLCEYHQQRELRTFREQARRLALFQQFAERVHRGLDLQAVAYQIANEGRVFLDCDRLSVLQQRGSRCRLLAVSGVDTFHRRANILRRIERLAAAVAATGETLWYPSSDENWSPKIRDRLQEYLDEAHVRTVAVVPLLPPAEEPPQRRPRPLGLLLVEKFSEGGLEPLRGAVEVVRSHSATAMQNALEMHSIPLSGLARRVGRVRRRLTKFRVLMWALLLGAIAAAVWALVYVPADFQIEVRGELQPCRLRDVFAPDDGVISQLRTEHGASVRAKEVLAVLRKPELDIEWKRVGGELQTARTRLLAVEAERLRDARDAEHPRGRSGQLTAQEEELRQAIRGLQEQLQILQQQMADLEVRSPIDGAVVTWNVQQLLQARPVSRGQILLTLADLAGPWQLELRIPDRSVAHILAARQEQGSDLDVYYTLVTDPGVRLQGQLERLGMRTEITESQEPVVLATVAIDRQTLPELIPGATVVAKVHCGRRPIGYVWLHELIDAVRTWMLF